MDKSSSRLSGAIDSGAKPAMDGERAPLAGQTREADGSSLVLTACLLGALMAFLVFSENFVFGSRAGNWSYSYLPKPNQIPAGIPIAVMLLLGLSIFVGSWLIHRHEKATLLGCFAASILVQILIQNVSAVPLASIVQDPEANGFYSVATKYSPGETLARYEALIPSFPQHVQTNMPGKILLFQLFGLFTTSPQVMGYYVILLSAAGAWLLYGICRRLFHDEQAAFYAFLLYALVPCKLFFLPLLNTVTPFFMLLCLYLFVTYIETKGVLPLALLGPAFYLLILFEPSPLVSGVIFVGILIHSMRNNRLSGKDTLALVLGTLLGGLCLYVLFRAFFSFDLVPVLRLVLQDAVEFNLRAQRGYWLWIGENAKEFFYGAGVPIVVIFIYQVAQMVVTWKDAARTIGSWSMERIYILSLLVTFGIVLGLGINRGEVSRLWIYMAVLFQIPAALFLVRLPRSTFLFFLVVGTVTAQTIIALRQVGFA